MKINIDRHTMELAKLEQERERLSKLLIEARVRIVELEEVFLPPTEKIQLEKKIKELKEGIMDWAEFAVKKENLELENMRAEIEIKRQHAFLLEAQTRRANSEASLIEKKIEYHSF